MTDEIEDTKWMEGYSVLMDRKTQYYQCVSPSQLDLWTRYTSIKISALFFVNIDELNLKFT